MAEIQEKNRRHFQCVDGEICNEGETWFVHEVLLEHQDEDVKRTAEKSANQT